MPPEKIDSLADDVKPLVLELLRQNSVLTARVDELVAQNKALLVRIAELEADHGKPPKTPDNSSLPPSRGQKGNVAEPTRVKKARKGHPGAARALAENPDATRDIYAERCACGAALAEAGQELARAWNHVDLPPIKPITTRINLFRATCPCCKARVTAQAPADMPEGSPFGPGDRRTTSAATSPGARSVPAPAAISVVIAAMPFSVSPKPAASSKSRSGTSLATDSPSRARTPSHACRKSSSPEPNRPNGHAFCPSYNCSQ